MTQKIDGERFLWALKYAAQAIPTDEPKARYQHLGIISNMLIGADGERWYCGILGEEGEVALPPLVVSRASVIELLDDLKYARKKARRSRKPFEAVIEDDAVFISYGAESPIVHRLDVMNLGTLPKTWKPPVDADAPPLASGGADLRREHMREAMGDGDSGAWSLRGQGGSSPVRVEVTEDGHTVGVAFLLPIQQPKAQLPLGDTLWDQGVPVEQRKSQSIFDLEWSGDGRIRPDAQAIKVGETKIDVTGLGDAADLIATGPCEHQEDDVACLACTQARVDEARRKVLVEEKRDGERPKRGRKKKAAQAEAEDST